MCLAMFVSLCNLEMVTYLFCNLEMVTYLFCNRNLVMVTSLLCNLETVTFLFCNHNLDLVTFRSFCDLVVEIDICKAISLSFLKLVMRSVLCAFYPSL